MSYSALISFKTIKEGELFGFFQQFKRHISAHIDEIAKRSFLYMPSHRSDKYNEYSKEEVDMKWAQTSIFSYKYFYLPEYHLLGVFGIPLVARELFDSTCSFQDVTSQNYNFEYWRGVDAFEKIAEGWKNATNEEVEKQYKEIYCSRYRDEEITIDIDHVYYRQVFAYKDIWSLCEKYLYNDSDAVCLSIFGYPESLILKRFVWKCEKLYKEYELVMKGEKDV